MCGNYKKRYAKRRSSIGSPPRVRELLDEIVPEAFGLGITPACAGITPSQPKTPEASRDHPRVCGNYGVREAGRGAQTGSPPRVRELLAFHKPIVGGNGITPACAGITPICFATYLAIGDHPRVCGNYEAKRLNLSVPTGSPPRVRELPAAVIIFPITYRITPACAGITDSTRVFPCIFQDHPRVCGNYLGKRHGTQQYIGSPPRVRELLTSSAIATNGLGITPACAGITKQKMANSSRSKDHPRVCGNYVWSWLHLLSI